MTDMPANTPRPIGRTWIFCPGTANADEDAEAFSCAAVAAGTAPLFEPALALEEDPPAAATAVPKDGGTLTVETEPATTAAPGEPLAAAACVVCDETDTAPPGGAATVETPFAVTAPLPPVPTTSVPDAVVVLEDVFEPLDEPFEEPLVVVELDEPDEPLLLLAPFMVTEQVLTSRTAGLPLSSVIGVRVITQVWVIWPTAVSVVCCVIRVVVPLPLSWRWTIGAAFAE